MIAANPDAVAVSNTLLRERRTEDRGCADFLCPWSPSTLFTCSIAEGGLIPVDKHKLAAWLHKEYEEIAVEVGWETQDGTSVLFDELPQDNQDVMLQLADRLLSNFEICEFQKKSSVGEQQ
jgi:hypothetical protein